MATAPRRRQQRLCVLPSPRIFASIAVRHQGMGCTQHHMRRPTTSHLLSTQRIFGVWRTNFPCRFNLHSAFPFTLTFSRVHFAIPIYFFPFTFSRVSFAINFFSIHFHFLLSCSTTQPSQRDSRCKSCECIPKCSQHQEVAMQPSGDVAHDVDVD